jgi:tRNA1Val (adenine37-N6)-methyltransferase
LSNQYFQFKKFTIHQDKCSMKVCTDSCLFGAWVASLIEKKIIGPKNILDIGTGTGLLTLMLAQKTNAGIDAVEFDKNAFEQATENAGASLWNNQIKVFHADIKKWNSPLKYDLIISNPPFYEGDLLPEDEGKTVSKHYTALNLEELIIAAKLMLTEDGTLAVLLPWYRTRTFENIASGHLLFVKEQTEVKQTSTHNYFRTMLILQKQRATLLKNEIAIKNKNNEYSPEFKELLRDYYLYLQH